LNNVVIANSGGTGIYADNQCAAIILSNVEVQRTNGTAVQQKSGFFTANELTMAFANAPAFPAPDQRDVGRGLHLSDGVGACATSIHSIGNDAGALLVEGAGTQVHVSGLESRLDRINPLVLEELVNSVEIIPGSGMVEVSDHALLLAQFASVSSGEDMAFILTAMRRRTCAIPISIPLTVSGSDQAPRLGSLQDSMLFQDRGPSNSPSRCRSAAVPDCLSMRPNPRSRPLIHELREMKLAGWEEPKRPRNYPAWPVNVLFERAFLTT
jgi:hypothetical protein